MENVVNFPLSEKCEIYHKWGDDFLNLEGAMILVVQLLRWSVSFDFVSAEYNQVSYLVYQRFLSGWICVSVYSFFCYFQTFPRLVMYGVYPIYIDPAGEVQWFSGRWVDGHRVESIISVEREHSISYCITP